MPRVSLVVDSAPPGGMRLDKWLASGKVELTRSRLKNGLLGLTVNGAPSKLSRSVKSGDVVSVEWEDPANESLEPEDIPLSILYEDDNVTVVDKRQGMVTHPGAGNWSGTLVNALLWHWGIKLEPFEGRNLRPGIVHRLDKDTSGVIITARNPVTESYLQDVFKSRRVRKTYLAILVGVPTNREGIIETTLMRDPRNRKRFTWTDKTDKGKRAKTGYRVLRAWKGFSLVAFRLYTGRTHQLRVHSRFLGCPILGDSVYGRREKSFPAATMMLHAWRLSLILPGMTEITRFESPIPERMRDVIDSLDKARDIT